MTTKSRRRDGADGYIVDNDTDHPLAGFWEYPRFAELLNVSERTVDRWVALGQCPVVKIGNKRLIPKEGWRTHLRQRLEESGRVEAA